MWKSLSLSPVPPNEDMWNAGLIDASISIPVKLVWRVVPTELADWED